MSNLQQQINQIASMQQQMLQKQDDILEICRSNHQTINDDDTGLKARVKKLETTEEEKKTVFMKIMGLFLLASGAAGAVGHKAAALYDRFFP